MTKRVLLALAAVVALPVVALAQKPASATDTVEVRAKIVAIDKTERTVVLEDEDGESEEIYCGPEMKRFDELKVGDTVTFKYFESLAYSIRKPGQPSGLPADTAPKMTRGTGARPSGTVARQETATVTIKAIDAKVPSVTVLTEDGRTVSFKVDDKAKLKDVKVGDRVEITYTEALMISVS